MFARVSQLFITSMYRNFAFRIKKKITNALRLETEGAFHRIKPHNFENSEGIRKS